MFKNIPKDKVLEVVKQGPTFPQRIVKQLGGDTMIIGAVLSTLISTGEVRYSALKVGGSPLYYAPGDEAKLEEFINYLNEKDQKAVKMLKDQKVMQDSTQIPLTRVSLKTAKDFSRPFESEHNGKKELFYRYFLVPAEEAELLASEIMKEQERLLTEKAEEKKAEEKKVEEAKAPISMPKEEMATERKKMQKTISEDEIKEDAEKEEKKVGKIISEREKAEKVPIHKGTSTYEKHHGKKGLFEKISDKIIDMGLDLISKEKIKRTEYAMILKNHDSNEYFYCVAKDKKAINEGDLATAYVFAHNKRMPCMFFMTGKLTKKAESMILKEFKEMKIEKL